MLSLGGVLYILVSAHQSNAKMFVLVGVILSLLFMIKVAQITTGIYEIPVHVFDIWLVQIVVMMIALSIVFSKKYDHQKSYQVIAVFAFFVAAILARISFYDLWSVAL